MVIFCNLRELRGRLLGGFIFLISFITAAENQLAPFGVVSNLCGLFIFYLIIIVPFFICLIERRPSL